MVFAMVAPSLAEQATNLPSTGALGLGGHPLVRSRANPNQPKPVDNRGSDETAGKRITGPILSGLLRNWGEYIKARGY